MISPAEFESCSIETESEVASDFPVSPHKVLAEVVLNNISSSDVCRGAMVKATRKRGGCSATCLALYVWLYATFYVTKLTALHSNETHLS